MAENREQPQPPRRIELASPCTRLELFLWARDLRPASLAREASLNRHYLLRVRKALLEPSRQKIAAMVAAARRLLHENVRPEEMFELSSEEGGLWLTAGAREELLERAQSMRRIERAASTLVFRVIHRAKAEWRAAFMSETPLLPLLRQMLRHATTLLDSAPADAILLLEIMHDLIAGARGLHTDEATELRGQTFLMRAFAQRQLGEFRSAVTVLDQAERTFEVTPFCMHQLGRTWYEIAALEFKRGELDRALRLARRARCTFVLTGDYRRAAYTKLVEGGIAFDGGNYREGGELFAGALAILTTFRDQDALGCAYVNLGSVATMLGDVAGAKSWLTKATAVFGKLRTQGEIVRTRWSFAKLQTMHEDRTDGLAKLRQARADFIGLGMPADAAMVGLDLVEFLLEDDRALDQAAAIARAAYDDLQRAGAPANALKALTYLREALRRRIANAILVGEIRKFVRYAPYRPEAEFAPGAAA